MNNVPEQSIERGMELAAHLPEIMPDQASERIRPVYEELQQVLRVPFVNLIFRSLANYPEYLVPAWQGLAPALRTQAFERAADTLRSQALLEPLPDAAGVQWDDLGDMDRIRPFNDTILYVLPKLLLIATALDQEVRGDLPGRSSADNDAEIPLGVAPGTEKLSMVDPDTASGRVHALFESVKERHGHPLVSSYYRVLGNWPNFLDAVWQRIEARVGSEAHEQRRDALIAQATAALAGMSAPAPDMSMLRDEQQAEVRAILAAFRRRFVPEMLIDVAWIEAMIDGEESVRSSPLSAAER